MRAAALPLLFLFPFLVLACPAGALTEQIQGQPAARVITLDLPHPLMAGESAWIIVRVGPIGHAQVDVSDAAGHLLGSVSLFAPHYGEEGGSHVIPLPAKATQGKRVTLRLTITHPSAPSRAPTDGEVRDVAVTVEPTR
ncbi:hypothetical protein [Nitrospirillum iridis]|uniref:Uncharacterized protein n=1 Tax=Nitrospirillum iridis TaxID=765888 RepID=A0A7X0B4D9_9PROT|nr:hypothetical protein [Nitrospirillum iridis]MBB6254226.1 hypothetical protein [Nitrospirillum iridis]